MWMSVVKDFRGTIPLRVQALPDGTWCPTKTPIAQIMNTEDGFGELVTWFEPILLKCAFPSGCATNAFKIKQYLESKNLPLHRVHSFGYRGYNSIQDAIWGGSAWNIFLTGTDDFHTKQYTPNAKISSIMATAHKVTQQFDDELKGEYHAIDATIKAGKNIMAMVIDTYDPVNFINNYLLKITQYAKDKGVHVVFRPDSGNLLEQTKQIYNMIKENGFTNVSVIIGEGMDLEKMKEFDKWFITNGVPLTFVNYGIGAGFYKHIERDTTGLAMKTAYSNGSNRMKLVKSDPFKQSIPGTVNLIRNEDNEMVVEYTRDGLFVDIYNFDNRSQRPFKFEQSWDDVQRIAHEQIEKGYINQEKIIISPEIETHINEFKLKYWNEK